MEKSTFIIRALIGLFTSIFGFLSLFFTDDEDENGSAFYH